MNLLAYKTQESQKAGHALSPNELRMRIQTQIQATQKLVEELNEIYRKTYELERMEKVLAIKNPELTLN